MAALDIGEVARRTGHSVATLRFYEAKGLIAAIGRRGLRRTYAAAVLQRLALVSLGRAAGFSLGEIASMLAPGSKPRIDKPRLAAKVAEINELIARLSAVRAGLLHALDCQAPDFWSCPHFQRVLKAVERHRLPAPPLSTGKGELPSRRAKGRVPRMSHPKASRGS